MRCYVRALSVLLALVAAGVLVFYEGGPRTAAAHAEVARSDPEAYSVLQEAPERVAVWFTEPVEPELSELRVFDSEGSRVDDGNTLFDRNDETAASVGLDDVADGLYTVSWKNVSKVDGHLVRGSFLFSVGVPLSGAETVAPAKPLFNFPAEPVLRWLTLLSALAMVGGPIFELLVARPVLFGRDAFDSVRKLGKTVASRSSRLMWAAAGVFLAASVLHLLFQASQIHEAPILSTLDGPAWSTITDTTWGQAWLWRMLATVGLAASLVLPHVADRRFGDEAGSGRWRMAGRLAVLVFGGGMLWTISMTSHGAATAGIRPYALFADYLHLAASAFWVGALFHFALSVPVAQRMLSQQGRQRCLAALTPRFTGVALLSVAVLIVTGVFGAWVQVNTPPALAMPYGAALIAKIVIVAPLLFLGALNLLWVRPRLPKSEAAGQWLGRLLVGEAALAVLVLASVGVLTSMEPARQVAAREGLGAPPPPSFEETVEGTWISVSIEPGHVGPNVVEVSLRDRLGAPIDNASSVSVRLAYLDADLGEPALEAGPSADSKYVLEDALISLAGAWQAEVTVRRPDAFDARTAFRFEVRPDASSSAAISGTPETAKLLLGSGMIALGVLFMGFGLPLGGWYSRAGAGVMVPGLAGFAVGAALLVNLQAGGQTAVEDLRNPYPPNAESLSAGAETYVRWCQSCHGASGRGDGLGAAGLDPPPADLVVHVPLHPEGELFRFIRDGISGTAMNGLADSLTEEEMWHVVNYIKTLE